MINAFKEHYNNFLPRINSKLKEFESLQNCNDKMFFEEMTFCVFAANSSAKMAEQAVSLLKNILVNGSLEDYKTKVNGKIRFYNIRSEYLFYNQGVLKKNKNMMTTLQNLNFEERRIFIKNNFKGFGLKESSHLLRNLGFKGYCIIDKHVLDLMNKFKIINVDKPRNEKEYLDIEKKIKKFAKTHNFCIDALDLALWSYKTGTIIK